MLYWIRRVRCHPYLPVYRCISYYDVLEIPLTATKSDIKKAYLEKAKEYHPDLNPDNPDAAQKFQEVQKAHDVLMDSQLRARYNSTLEQQSYYSTGKTHRFDEEPIKYRQHSNVKKASMKNPFENPRNSNFHHKHRTNNDNYRPPGATSNETESTEKESPFVSREKPEYDSGFMTSHQIVVMALAAACLAYCVGQIIYQGTLEVLRSDYQRKEENRRMRNIIREKHLIRVDPKVNGTVGVETPRYSYDPEKKLMYQFPPKKTNGSKNGKELKGNGDKTKSMSRKEINSLRKKLNAKEEEYLKLKQEYSDAVEKLKEKKDKKEETKES